MIIRDIPQSGKLGLTVSYQGRTGLIRRELVIPKNPQTSSQMSVRTALASMASQYDALTDPQQEAWITAAASFKTRPRLGQSGPLTGLQLFTKVNCQLIAIGAPTVTDPPGSAVIPEVPVTGLTLTNTGGTVALNLNTSDAPAQDTMLWGCPWQKSGVRRVISPRFLGTLNSPVNDKIDITSAYVAKFGAPPADSRIYVQVNASVNGIEGPRLTFSGRVPAGS